MTGAIAEIRDSCEELRGKCLPQAPLFRHVEWRALSRAVAPGWYTVENSCGAAEFGGTLATHRVIITPWSLEASRALSLPALPDTWPLPGMRLFPELWQLLWQSLCVTERVRNRVVGGWVGQ